MPQTTQGKIATARSFEESNRVLIVDDEGNIRLTLAQALHPLGLAVDTAASGREALGKLQEQRYGLMFLDLRMPDTGGMDVLEKAIKIQPELPVIVFTAYGTPETAAEAMKRGAADFVQKPFTPEEFRDTLRQTWSLGHLRAANGHRSPSPAAAPAAYRVVVPVADPSVEDFALRLAAAVAHSHERGELLAVSVIELPRQTPLNYYKDFEDERSWRQKQLLRHAQEEAGELGIELRPLAIYGRHAHHAILMVLEEKEANHVLMTWSNDTPAPGDSDAQDQPFGESTIGAIARRAACEVTLVKVGQRKIRNVVALVSEGPHAPYAARRAFEFARSTAVARITLLNVQRPDAEEGPDAEEHRSPEEAGLQLIRSVAEKADLPEGKYEPRVIVSENIEAAVLEAANGFDTICIGASRHAPMTQALFGSSLEAIGERFGEATVVVARGPGAEQKTFIKAIADRLSGRP